MCFVLFCFELRLHVSVHVKFQKQIKVTTTPHVLHSQMLAHTHSATTVSKVSRAIA
jgi:hypothetical protein